MSADPTRQDRTPPMEETRIAAAPRAAAAAAETTPPPSLSPGMVILHTYEIIRLIGRGGMGEIYQAEHRDQRTLHAIKIIRPDLVGDESIINLFLREAEALRKIRHAAIVAYDGLFRDATGRLHLVMEYVDGPSLRDRLRDGPLGPEEIRQLCDRLAGGLAEAHDKGIYHRDLSPDNVILEHGQLERAKLIDFGIARIADPNLRTLVGARFAGKLSWASPEQIGLFGAQIDGRSDIYSLGLVLAAAARGRPLEMGQTMMDTVEARKMVPDLDGVPAGLAIQIAHMLAPNPLDRPQSMRVLLGANEPGEASLPPTRPAPAFRPEPPVHTEPAADARRIAPRAWSLAAVLAVAMAGSLWWWLDRAPAPAAPAALLSRPPAAASPSPRPAGGDARTAATPLAELPGQPSDPGPATGSERDIDSRQLSQIMAQSPAEIFAAGQRFLTERRDADTALVLWEEASRRGNGDAALGIAGFYDPQLWSRGPNPFTAPNPAKARDYYALALQRGIGAARARLQALDNSGLAR